MKALVTAFRPFGPWQENSSWLALRELTRNLPESPQLITRLYPVDFAEMPSRLNEDLRHDVDLIIHLGQSAHATEIALETFALNVGCEGASGEPFTLAAAGPPAYQTRAPIASIVEQLRSEEAPVRASYHAGVYLCNAVFYLSHFLCEQQGKAPPIVFAHLPLDESQASAAERDSVPTLAAATSAAVLRRVIELLAAELPCPATTGASLQGA